MNINFLKVVLVCSILFSCTSEREESLDAENATNIVSNRQATGSSANDLLAANTFKKIIVEIAYIDGFEPTEKAKKSFKKFIENRTFKPEGVVFVEKQIPTIFLLWPSGRGLTSAISTHVSS